MRHLIFTRSQCRSWGSEEPLHTPDCPNIKGRGTRWSLIKYRRFFDKRSGKAERNNQRAAFLE